MRQPQHARHRRPPSLLAVLFKMPRTDGRRRLGRFILGITLLTILGGALFASLGSGEPDDGDNATSVAHGSTPSTSSPSISLTAAPSTTARETTSSTTSSTTTTTTTSTTTTTTTTLPTLYMKPDGLGLVDLGMAYDVVVTAVGEELGEPTSDSGWVGANSSFGTCPGAVLRVVQWHSLRLFFSDGPTEFGRDERHLFYFSQSTVDTDETIDLRTAAGVGLGSTVAELEEAYGSFLDIQRSTAFGSSFVIDGPGPSLLSGTLTSTQDTGEVTSIGGGYGCGA